MITTTAEAISAIVSYNTLPSQIDFISPGMKYKYQSAIKFVESLPAEQRYKVNFIISNEIDAYYSPTFEGDDGESYSPSDMMEMFWKFK